MSTGIPKKKLDGKSYEIKKYKTWNQLMMQKLLKLIEGKQVPLKDTNKLEKWKAKIKLQYKCNIPLVLFHHVSHNTNDSKC